MRPALFVAFSLHHFIVAQMEDGISPGSRHSHPEYSCSTETLSELKEIKSLVAELKAILDKLKKQGAENLCSSEIPCELKELKKTVIEQKEKLEELQKEVADKPKVAFSASLFGQGGQTLGGYTSEVILKFLNVFINIGSAYDPSTGVFTAPVRGVYYFGFSAFANNAHSMGVCLRKNGQNIVATYDYNSNHKDVNGANRAVLLLEKGDQVHIGLWSGLSIFDSYNSVSTFSGFLLFLM
ncbi:complement C1q tumor necrosis factor-related protein 3-like [Brachyhypopomus gauderio]|uniref:complement C1q tumor necrosis factor-related protein 3-like n=1 Tax=Brachyhypopomus gauderio TaxID=698409 RepID=UPI004042D319